MIRYTISFIALCALGFAVAQHFLGFGVVVGAAIAVIALRVGERVATWEVMRGNHENR